MPRDRQARARPTSNGAGPSVSARRARLRYVSDAVPGITRRRAGRAFVYRSPRGRVVRDPRTLARIRSLAIPPAWEQVWICPHPDGHLQATGRDARGRKQYRYHPRWSAVRGQAKYDRMIGFAQALPALRRRVAADLRQPVLTRQRVLATVVRLLETTLIRVGNDEYARANGSFGLTTLLDRHAEIRGSRVRFRFRAKSGVAQTVDLEDAALARSVKRCQELPGQTLFQYVDAEDRRRRVESGDVNEYLRNAMGEDYTAKDFRTWAGTVLAACALAASRRGDTRKARKRAIVSVVDTVAGRLGNTRAVCRRCYVHPAVFDSYLEGSTLDLVVAPSAGPAARSIPAGGLSREEKAVLAFLRRSQPRQASAPRAA